MSFFQKKLSRDNVTVDDDEEEEDAFEMLFKQLEEDLKNDDLSKDGSDDEISEEDLALLERELEDALGDFDAETLNPDVNDAESDGNDTEDEEEEENDDDERLPKLRTWQMKKLARALKTGRRKTSVSALLIYFVNFQSECGCCNNLFLVFQFVPVSFLFFFQISSYSLNG